MTNALSYLAPQSCMFLQHRITDFEPIGHLEPIQRYQLQQRTDLSGTEKSTDRNI